MNINKKHAFTLVELIVVITILAILGTIAFISLQGYSKSARDSARTTDLKNIGKGLELALVKKSVVPMPKDYVEVTLSGTLIGYQGDMGLKALGTIGVSEARDPLDKEFYSYFVSADLTKYQIMGYLEDSGNLSLNFSETFAATDYTNRFPYVKGNSLGMLIDENNVVIHRMDGIGAEFDMLGNTYSGTIIQPLFDNSTHIKEKAFRWGGQLLTASKNQKFSGPHNCPENFIPVPGNRELGQPGFCIGKYEVSAEGATDSGSGTYELTSLDTYSGLKVITKQGSIPLSNIRFDKDDRTGLICESIGKGYHIMTLNEWLTIARNIEKQPANWSGGIVGEGNIKTGNSGDSNGLGDQNTVYPAGIGSSNDSLRELTLSNGETIFDFIGNVWEAVRPLNLTDKTINEFLDVKLKYLLEETIEGDTAGYTDLGLITDKNYKNHFGPRIGVNSIQGIGTLKNAKNGYYLVGGDYKGTNENGLYSILKYDSNDFNTMGTRCAYSGK